MVVIVRSIMLSILLAIPFDAIAGMREISSNDYRLPRGHIFVDVKREIRNNRLYVTIEPPVGAWSQSIDCAGGDRPISVKTDGNIAFRLPGGKKFYEANPNVQGDIQSIKSWGVYFFGKRNWYATDLGGGGSFGLECPSVRNPLNTRYHTINEYNKDGTLPVPTCITQDDWITCTVLSSDIWNRLNERKWGVGPSFASHQKVVSRYNSKVQETIAARKRSEMLASAKKFFWIAVIIIGLLVVVGYVQREVKRQN